MREGRPIVVLGGPEVSYLPDDAHIFGFADYVVRGEGELAFRALCENVLQNENEINELIYNVQDNLSVIKTGYYLYTDEDVARKLIYVESSRGCPFECEFCLSAVEHSGYCSAEKTNRRRAVVREFPIGQFLADMDTLINRGVRTIKFLDRTFNANIGRALKICKFFLGKLEERERKGLAPFVVHFEMVPSLFNRELCEMLSRFPPGSLRLEIGVQTLNTEVSNRIRRPGWRNHSIDPEKDLETIRFLRKNTHAIIHADLIAGLPGEDLQSFGRGFDKLWRAVRGKGRGKNFYHEPHEPTRTGEEGNEKLEMRNEEREERGEKMELGVDKYPLIEIQVGILKLLPGAPISRHNETFGMRYNCKPPYEIEENSAISAVDLQRVKNFAAFWERLVNRGLLHIEGELVFEKFMALSDSLFEHFGKNWGIDRSELVKKAIENLRGMRADAVLG